MDGPELPSDDDEGGLELLVGAPEGVELPSDGDDDSEWSDAPMLLLDNPKVKKLKSVALAEKPRRQLKRGASSAGEEADHGLAAALAAIKGEPDLPSWVWDIIRAVPQVLNIKLEQDDVWELFSPPRVVPVCQRLGLRGGLSCDLRNGWDFGVADHQGKMIAMLCGRKPKVVILSPPCTWFSSLQDTNWQEAQPD